MTVEAGREVPEILRGLRIPQHIAVIMDGNGRWAKQRGLSRVEGHRRGAEVVREITRECARLGVRRLTLYSFSWENWNRPREEVDALMRLLRRYLVRERREIMDNDIVFRVIGRVDRLPAAVRREMERTIEMSAQNRGMVLCLALSYGAREEIVDAARRLAAEVAAGRLRAEDIDEAVFARYLYDPEAPDPDLLIRTGGEMRLSNFLLWQISYAEFYVTPELWPDFRREHLHRAIVEFNSRERRFGRV